MSSSSGVCRIHVSFNLFHGHSFLLTYARIAAILPLLHHFSYLLAQSNSKLYYTSLQISVSYTRCFANPPAHVMKVLQNLPAGLRVTPGRPKLQSTLNSVVDMLLDFLNCFFMDQRPMCAIPGGGVRN